MTSLQNNSRVMCQNKVKTAKNYQRPLHLWLVKMFFMETVKNAYFATKWPTIFQHYICHFYETNITDLSTTFCWRLVWKSTCPHNICQDWHLNIAGARVRRSDTSYLCLACTSLKFPQTNCSRTGCGRAAQRVPFFLHTWVFSGHQMLE